MKRRRRAWDGSSKKDSKAALQCLEEGPILLGEEAPVRHPALASGGHENDGSMVLVLLLLVLLSMLLGGRAQLSLLVEMMLLLTRRMPPFASFELQHYSP